VFPFRSDPEDDILAFDVYFRDDQGRRIIFVARRRALLSLAAVVPQATNMQSTTRAWEDWGPRTTHWMELDPQKDSISLAGSRCVLVKYLHLRDHFVLDLRDFNPYRIRVRSAHDKTVTAGGGGGGVTYQAVLSAEACFEEDVVSELPFVSIKKENVGSRVLLDDEWMAEILVRRPFSFVLFCLHLITSATGSGITMPKRRSFSSVPLPHPRSCALDRIFYYTSSATAKCIMVSYGPSFADGLQVMYWEIEALS
jgi:hypothetical protein